MILVAAHGEQVGRGQHGDRDARVGQQLAEISQLIGQHGGIFRAVADRDAAAPADFVGQFADLVDVEVIVVAAHVEMDIDIDVVFLRQFEDAVDLASRVLVIGRCTTDGPGAALQPFDEIRIALRHTGPAFLKEHTEFEVDAPGHILRQLLQRIEALHADIGVELHMGAHMGDAADQRGLDGGAGAGINIFHGESGLHCRDTLHVVGAAVR